MQQQMQFQSTSGIKYSEIEVTQEDQLSINQFSSTHQQFKQLVKEIQLQEELKKNLEEAITELELYEDEENGIKTKFGDSFITLSIEQSKEIAEKQEQDATYVLNQQKDDLASLEKKIKKLKANLYAKFGNTIYLEED